MARNIIYNIDYYFKEVKTIIKIDFLSNFLSLLSMGLIFLILGISISGSWVLKDIVQLIKGESEISIYYDENIKEDELSHLLESISKIDGIGEINLVSKDEAYERMERILGKEASVMGYFEENPFSPFIEANIDLDKIDDLLIELSKFEKIEYIRNNRDVLEKINDLSRIINLLSYIIIIGVGISTVIIISHIIRQGIYNNKDAINTLRLLGAPDYFIGLPFLMVGLFLTLGSGVLASILNLLAYISLVPKILSSMPFIPLSLDNNLTMRTTLILVIFGGFLGILGSLIGIRSIKER